MAPRLPKMLQTRPKEPRPGDADFYPNTTTSVAIGESSADGTTGGTSTGIPPKKVFRDDRDLDGDGIVDPKEREDAWALNPKNPKSVNHPDYVKPPTTLITGSNYQPDKTDPAKHVVEPEVGSITKITKNPEYVEPGGVTGTGSGTDNLPNPFGSNTTLLNDGTPKVIKTTTSNTNWYNMPDKIPTAQELAHPGESVAVAAGQTSDDGTTGSIKNNSTVVPMSGIPAGSNYPIENNVPGQGVKPGSFTGAVIEPQSTPAIEAAGLGYTMGDPNARGSRGAGHTASMAGGSNPNNLRRVVRAKKSLIGGAR